MVVDTQLRYLYLRHNVRDTVTMRLMRQLKVPAAVGVRDSASVFPPGSSGREGDSGLAFRHS